MKSGNNTTVKSKTRTMTRVREEEVEDAKPRALGPSKKSQIIVPSERQQRPSRVKRSSSSAAAGTSSKKGYYGDLDGGNDLDRHTSHHSSNSSHTTASKKHQHRRSSSSVSWKCEGATTEDSGLDQFIAANNRGVVFDFVNSFSSNGSKASLLPNSEVATEEDKGDDDENVKAAKHTSSRAAKPAPAPTPPSSLGLASNLKPPPPSSMSRPKPPAPPTSKSKSVSKSNLKPPPPSSRVDVVRDKNELLFIEENNRNALSDFVRSVSSSTSETAISTCTASSRTIDDDIDEYDVENQKMMITMKDDVSISKSKSKRDRQLERARVGASIEERQREVAVKTLMFFALAIALFVLNQKIRSTEPDGSDTPYFTTVVEQMLSGIERIKSERQTGPD